MRSAQLSRAKQCAMVLLLAMALTGVFLILLCVGRYSVPPLEAFRIMGVALFRDGQALEALKAENPFGVSVILGSRLPRLLMGMIVGAACCCRHTQHNARFPASHEHCNSQRRILCPCPRIRYKAPRYP